MKITIINQFFPPDVSPTGRLAASLAAHRASLGDDVTVIASQGYASQADAAGIATDGVCIRRVWTPPLAKKTTLRRCTAYAVFLAAAGRRVLQLPAQDVVICLTTPPFIEWLGVLHKLLHPQTKLILWSMDCYPEVAERAGVIKTGGVISRLLHALNRPMMRRLDHVVCLDDAMRMLMQSRQSHRGRGHVDTPLRTASSVIPNWEPLATFPSLPLFRLRDTEAPIRIVYTGNMGHGHCFDAVIDAAAKLRGEAVEFVFTGSGAKAPEIERHVKQRRLNNVKLLGYISTEQLRALQHSADAAMITLGETMAGVVSPSKLHASLAMGLPILYIGPQQSNVDAAISKHRCGASLRNNDANGIVEFVRSLRRDPVAHRAMRRNARHGFEADYCDAASLAKFDRIFDALASPGSLDSRAAAARPRRAA